MILMYLYSYLSAYLRTYAGDLRTSFARLLLPWDGENALEKAADFSMRFWTVIPSRLGMLEVVVGVQVINN
jgi:hypothetical protein